MRMITLPLLQSSIRGTKIHQDNVNIKIYVTFFHSYLSRSLLALIKGLHRKVHLTHAFMVKLFRGACSTSWIVCRNFNVSEVSDSRPEPYRFSLYRLQTFAPIWHRNLYWNFVIQILLSTKLEVHLENDGL